MYCIRIICRFFYYLYLFLGVNITLEHKKDVDDFTGYIDNLPCPQGIKAGVNVTKDEWIWQFKHLNEKLTRTRSAKYGINIQNLLRWARRRIPLKDDPEALKTMELMYRWADADNDGDITINGYFSSNCLISL